MEGLFFAKTASVVHLIMPSGTEDNYELFPFLSFLGYVWLIIKKLKNGIIEVLHHSATFLLILSLVNTGSL
jgi:hypothetical protein